MEYLKYIKKLIRFICILTIVLVINKTNYLNVKYKIRTEKEIKNNININYLIINDYKLIVEEGKEKDILDKNKVYYMPNSQKDNYYLAGHNSKTVFNKIYYLKINDEIIYHINNESITYIVIDKKYINVDDNSIFNKKNYNSLILITCSFTNQKRYVVLCKKKSFT